MVKTKNVKSISSPSEKAKPDKTKKKSFVYRSFKKSKRIKRDNSGLPSAFQLFGQTYNFLIKNWKIMGGVTLIYGLLYYVFVRVGPSVDLNEYRDLIDDYFGADTSAVLKSFTLAGVALASASQGADQVQTLMGVFLVVVASLAFIWAIRHILAKKSFRIRDAYYKSQEPLIPFLLMILIITIQAIPFAIGALLYSVVKAQNITVSGGEDLIFISLWVFLALLSGYWIANSLMALYAVTLPGLYPMQALRATKKLVEHRRWFILRKILFLPFVMFAVFGVVFLFLVSVAPSIVFEFIDLSAVIMLPFAHVYLYHLYRSLV